MLLMLLLLLLLHVVVAVFLYFCANRVRCCFIHASLASHTLCRERKGVQYSAHVHVSVHGNVSVRMYVSLCFCDDFTF